MIFNSSDFSLQKLSDVGIAMILVVAFSFVVAGHAVYPVKERVRGEKRLQLIYGVHPMMYWLVTFFWQLVSVHSFRFIKLALPPPLNNDCDLSRVS